jgi:hypothetical protein
VSVELEDMWDELHRGKVWECSLSDPRWHLDGMQSGEHVYIDPRFAILETLVHELLHRRKPRMGERAVTRHARYLVARMDDQTKARWWRAYRRIVKKGRPVHVDE